MLFLERYVDWLAPGGVVVTVVPDSILANRGAYAELRIWLHQRCQVMAVFSLPPVAFAAAGTSTKTSVLVLKKHSRLDQTFFGLARDVGFDVVTRSGQRRRVRTARNDLPKLVAHFSGSGSSDLGRPAKLDTDAERWDAPFHIGLPQRIATAVVHPQKGLIKVADVSRLVDERCDPRRSEEKQFCYVEIADIDPRTSLVGYKKIFTAEAPSRARKRVRSGDVLVSTVRPERGAVGVVPPHLDGAICSTGFAVLRCFASHPLTLAWLLKTKFVRQQMVRNNVGIAYPAMKRPVCHWCYQLRRNHWRRFLRQPICLLGRKNNSKRHNSVSACRFTLWI
ncbi:MAG: N-6 DNA methylase [Bacteroidota bacterium]